MNRTRLTQAVRSKVRSRSLIFYPPAILLCVVCLMTGISLLFESHLLVSAAPPRQNGVEKLLPSGMNLPRLASFGPLLAKSSSPEDQLWRENPPVDRENPRIDRDNPRIDIAKSLAEINAAPKFYRTLSLNEIAQRKLLRQAPMEFSKAARQTRLVMTLPLPDGKFARFRVEESPVMAPRLAALFPEIRTYRGQGLDDPTATTRFDMTPAGFHAIVLSAQGTVIIEPAAHGRAGQYVSYDQRDAPQDESSSSCLLFGAEQAAQPESKLLPRSNYANPNTPNSSTLRTYRLALAATA